MRMKFVIYLNYPSYVQLQNAYEERIKKYGGIELFLGGIGSDGHIVRSIRPNVFLGVSEHSLVTIGFQ